MRAKLSNPNITKFRSDGSLTIHYGLNNYHAIKILSWDDGCHTLIKRNKGWEYTDEFIDLVLVSRTSYCFSDTALTLFGKPIPNDVKITLSKYKTHQLRILQFIASNSYAYDLFKSNPTLLWMLLEWSHEAEGSTIDLKNILLKKQKNILKYIFPKAREKHVKLMKKIKFTLFDSENHKTIRSILSYLDEFPQLNHCEYIDFDTANMFSLIDLSIENNSKLVSAILNNYQEEVKECVKDIVMTFTDCINMQRELYPQNLRPSFLQHKFTINDVYRCHVKLVQEYNDPYINTSLRVKHPEKQLFPKPFYQGNCNVVHINNLMDLHNEGLEMNHCIASYKSNIITGKSCIYKILSPQRATLELTKHHGKYKVNQVMLKSNKTASKSTFDSIYKWIKSSVN